MQIHGVDFSGADNGGLHKIRIASISSNGEVVIERADRAMLMKAILASASSQEAHLWRIDAPAGVPIQTLTEHGIEIKWKAGAKWSASAGSPRAWRTMLRAVSRVEPRRSTDSAWRTPMAPMNLRVFKQTWTLMCEVLLPLSEAGVSIAPMAVTNSNVTVCEGCPASVLQMLGWPSHGYKGQGEPPKRVRALIARRLVEIGVPLSKKTIQQATDDEEGDLLDACILLTPPTHTVVPVEGAVEGWIY